MERPIHNVLLPPRFWEVAAGDQAELKRLIAGYMRVGYPNYQIKQVVKKERGYFGVCERVK